MANLPIPILTPALEIVTGIQGAGVVSRGPGALPDFDGCARPPVVPKQDFAGVMCPDVIAST